MRHSWAAKQRIWLGPGRYFCGGKRRIANTDTDSNGHLDADCNSDRDGNSDTNANAYSYRHSYSYFDAESDAHAKIWAIGEASSDSGASSIEVFARTKISSNW